MSLSKKKAKIFNAIVWVTLFAILQVALIGVVLPYLISADRTELVVVGFLISVVDMFLTAFLILMFGSHFNKLIKGYKYG